jgi:hypothetical protein
LLKALKELRHVYGVTDVTIDADRLTVEMMQWLGNHRDLTGLGLRFKSAESGADRLICCFPRLKDLWLEGPTSEEAFCEIAKLVQLKEIYVELPSTAASKQVDFCCLKDLKKATMKGAPPSAEYFKAFAKCPQLARIEFKALQFRDLATAGLSELGAVTWIIINDDCEAAPSLFAALAKMKSLKQLTCDVKMSDNDLRELGQCKSLREVYCVSKPADSAIGDFLSGDPDRKRQLSGPVAGVQFRYTLEDGKVKSHKLIRYMHINVGVAR